MKFWKSFITATITACEGGENIPTDFSSLTLTAAFWNFNQGVSLLELTTAKPLTPKINQCNLIS